MGRRETVDARPEPRLNVRTELTLLPMPAGAPPVEWRISDGPVAYEDGTGGDGGARRRHRRGKAPEQVWLLEHPPLYTAGTSARPQDVIEARFPVHEPAAAASSPITARASAWPM